MSFLGEREMIKNLIISIPCLSFWTYFVCFAEQTYMRCISEGHSETITCCGGLISISDAFYGHNYSNECSNFDLQETSACIDEESTNKIKEECNGKTACLLQAANGVFGDPCPGVQKYIYVKYTCKAGCPNGWTRGSGLPYCYVSPDSNRRNFTDSLQVCLNLGGDIIMPKSQEENDVIADFMKGYSIEGFMIWIGLTDTEREDEWKWIDGESMVYQNWSIGEPNNYGDGEDCAGFFLSNYRWNDISCDWTFQTFCQTNLKAKCEDDLKVINSSGTMVNIDGCSFNSTLTYKCESPYYKLYGGDLVRTCSDNGNWNGSEPSCHEVTCSNDTRNINESGILRDISGFYFNDNLIYVCDPPGKKVIHGNLTRSCTENGTWSGEEPVCETVTCTSDQDKINSSGCLMNMTGNYINDTLMYKCDLRYHKLKGGDLTRLCTANGTWSGNEPRCERCNCTCKNRTILSTSSFNEIIEDMKIDTKSTSKVLRSKISANDDRPSSQGIGFIGVFILIFVVVISVIPDIPSLILDIKLAFQNIKSMILK